jgi:hypothetical protein
VRNGEEGGGGCGKRGPESERISETGKWRVYTRENIYDTSPAKFKLSTSNVNSC